jgi:hypothetical protein
VRHAANGRDLGPADLVGGAMDPADLVDKDPCIRMLNRRGQLVGIAAPAGARGLLHPSVVLM